MSDEREKYPHTRRHVSRYRTCFKCIPGQRLSVKALLISAGRVAVNPLSAMKSALPVTQDFLHSVYLEFLSNCAEDLYVPAL